MINIDKYNITEMKTERQDKFNLETLPHHNALYNYALKISKNHDDAQDLLQETYYKAYKNYQQFEKGTNSKAWLYMILKNTFINNYRKLKREPAKVNYDEMDEHNKNIKLDGTMDNNLELDFYKDLLDDDLSDALTKLPTKMREVFLLYDLEGYTYEEIAEIGDCPIGTVRSRLHRARYLLKENLFEYAKNKGVFN